MINDLMKPDYIFETAWEVCNKVGGVYTVLSTRAKTLQSFLKDKIFFLGPDIWQHKDNPNFIEDTDLFVAWRNHATDVDGLNIRIGRWNVPGKPIAILVDSHSIFSQKDNLYGMMWEKFHVDSLHAYGDYDECCMFAVCAAKVAESFYHFNNLSKSNVIFHANEWQTAMAALYIQNRVPEIATVFTTHATTIGRSIAFNNKDLYKYMDRYDGDQMAGELNVQAKHSVEKRAAQCVDCFTTVSDITAAECSQLLDKSVDEVLMNGFDNSFVPDTKDFASKRKIARKTILNVANKLMGANMDDNTLIYAISGRYEFRNKGIDVFLEALNQLTSDSNLKKNVLGLITVPAWVGNVRGDLKERLNENKSYNTPLEYPYITHWLNNADSDQISSMLNKYGMSNGNSSKVKIMFVPCYLDGNDGIINIPYYDVVIGNDLTAYPSYYEPWGYTPLESIAFHVPTITTDLSGFGRWVNKELGKEGELTDGVKVIHRTDDNFNNVVGQIEKVMVEFSNLTDKEIEQVRRNAYVLSKRALWNNFIQYYYKAYDIAFRNARKRLMDKKSNLKLLYCYKYENQN
ncbi:MAG: glycogen/starch synthase [Phocaeicola sp.]|uniref:glycogen/starch synthase n=1 Tax=Phocaeicola sp. TaxID=2773926 RepID=UPI003FA187E5